MYNMHTCICQWKYGQPRIYVYVHMCVCVNIYYIYQSIHIAEKAGQQN